jgi:hypothetical protein
MIAERLVKIWNRITGKTIESSRETFDTCRAAGEPVGDEGRDPDNDKYRQFIDGHDLMDLQTANQRLITNQETRRNAQMRTNRGGSQYESVIVEFDEREKTMAPFVDCVDLPGMCSSQCESIRPVFFIAENSSSVQK